MLSGDLVTVQTPVLQLLLKQRPAHIGRVVELARPVVVEDLAEDSRVSAVEREDSISLCYVCKLNKRMMLIKYSFYQPGCQLRGRNQLNFLINL